jgi:hypothetical protein
MSFWQNVWRQVARELPAAPSRPRTWGGFLGALAVAIVMIAIWFPIRLAHEILKALDLSDKPDRRAEAQALFRDAYELSRALPTKAEFASSALAPFSLPRSLHDALFDAVRDLYADNVMLDPPAIPADLDDLDGVRWRDALRRDIARLRGNLVGDMRRACQDAIEAATGSIAHVQGSGDVTAPLASLTPPGAFVEKLITPLTADLFPAFAARYMENVYAISGVAPGARPAKPPKLAEPRHLDDPSPFLAATPFAAILRTPLAIDIPQAARMSHHWIVAGTGAGKTNALQYLIGQDLQRAARGECSIVVLDSQRQLIETLAHLDLFAPGGALDGKLCLLDAADVEYPLAVNLFDMKLDRIASLSMLEREKLMNSALEMYDFVIGSLLQAEMTSRQSTLFRFVTRALFAIPGATIHTFQDILQNGVGGYQAAIDALDETTRRFFASEFNSAQFRQTKEQVVARLWAVLSNHAFARMFATPRSKIDIAAAIDTPGQVILINAEKGLLKEEGAELFGRFFLALINQAAAQRSIVPRAQRLPCFVYVDECHNYIRNDPKIQVILAESRQQNVGLVLAHQFLGQIEPPVLRALAANTSIKMAARLEGADRSAMARDMNTVPDFIRDQKVGAFATLVRGETPHAISMRFPLNPLARFPRMSAGQWTFVRDRNRALYANEAADAPHASIDPSAPAKPPPRRPRADPDAPR